jgi:hypothetical protein
MRDHHRTEKPLQPDNRAKGSVELSLQKGFNSALAMEAYLCCLADEIETDKYGQYERRCVSIVFLARMIA